eukprot:CAMPEP_0180395552 /NCGR_PEP_ID=MMETSP0989-20121125/34956_1 /TAXON_ID=697907 /ORGANISM="non described non described, Strain CCMP2293" /LENGTH=47 /DNA_ID= /DNA_START= /DNA_END= /DNA_ORIENTATION=
MSGPETESFHDAIPSVDLSAVYEDEDSEGEAGTGIIEIGDDDDPCPS